MKILKYKRFLITIVDLFIIGFSFCLKPITDFMFKTGLSECTYRKMGFICPGCGGTRCVANLAVGNFVEAFRFNPGVFCGIIYILITVLMFNLEIWFDLNFAKKARKILTDYRLFIGLLILFIVFGYSRNFFVDFL